jgi:hypothetical protein
MSKTFYVEPGYEARSQGAWYGAGLLLWVEHDGQIEVFEAPGGKRGRRLGSYAYAALDTAAPPPGLRAAAAGPPPPRAD